MTDNDLLEVVLRSAETRKYLSPINIDWPTFTLISWRTFTSKNAKQVRRMQSQSLDQFGVKLAVIGGGYGCTKIIFAVQAATHEDATNFILNVIDKPAFRSLAVEAEFRVAIVSEPYIRTDLQTGLQELSPYAEKAKLQVYAKELNLMVAKTTNTITNIHGSVKDSNLSIGSTGNTMQLTQYAGQNEISKQLDEIRNLINQNKTLTQHKRTEALDLVEAIEEEAKKEKPKKALLKSFADSLNSFSSIGGSVAKVVGLLGLGS